VRRLHQKDISYGRLSRILSMPKSTLAAMGHPTKQGEHPCRLRTFGEEALKLWIRLLKGIKPTWGIRRVRAWIRKALEMPIGRKRTARLLREEGLLCPRIKKREHRNQKPRAQAARPNEVWAMDMTQFMLASGSKLFLVIVLDIFPRRIVGFHLSARCRAKEWLEALDMAVRAEFPEGARGKGLTLRLDNGCQPTSKAFQDALSILEITPEWTGYNSPKQNAHVERVIGTLKADWLWIEECDTFQQAQDLVSRAVTEYNQEHPHSSLDFLSPDEFRRLWEINQVNIYQTKPTEVTLKAA